MVTPLEDESSLHGLGVRVRGELRALARCIPTYVEEEIQRLDSWASNVGLDHDGHRSLDNRLGEDTNLRRYLRAVLCDLSSYIARGERPLFRLKRSDLDIVPYTKQAQSVTLLCLAMRRCGRTPTVACQATASLLTSLTLTTLNPRSLYWIC